MDRETPLQYASRLLRDAHAAAEAGDAENALIDANGAVEMLRVELGEAEDPRGVVVPVLRRCHAWDSRA